MCMSSWCTWEQDRRPGVASTVAHSTRAHTRGDLMQSPTTQPLKHTVSMANIDGAKFWISCRRLVAKGHSSNAIDGAKFWISCRSLVATGHSSNARILQPRVYLGVVLVAGCHEAMGTGGVAALRPGHAVQVQPVLDEGAGVAGLSDLHDALLRAHQLRRLACRNLHLPSILHLHQRRTRCQHLHCRSEVLANDVLLSQARTQQA